MGSIPTAGAKQRRLNFRNCLGRKLGTSTRNKHVPTVVPWRYSKSCSQGFDRLTEADSLDKDNKMNYDTKYEAIPQKDVDFKKLREEIYKRFSKSFEYLAKH